MAVQVAALRQWLDAGAFGLARSGPSPQLVMCAVLFAIGMSGTLPMMDARVLEVTGSDRTRYGLVRACGSASFMVCAPLIGFLANSHGPASLFLIMVPALVMGGLAASAIPGRSQVLRAPSMLRAPGRVLSHRPIGFFLFGSLACWTAIYAQTGFFSLYLKSVGAPDDQVGLAWSLGSLGEIPTMIFFPVLARRFGVERLIMLGAGLTVTRQIVNTVFTVPAVLLAFSLLHGAGYAMLETLRGPLADKSEAWTTWDWARISMASIARRRDWTRWPTCRKSPRRYTSVDTKRMTSRKFSAAI